MSASGGGCHGCGVSLEPSRGGRPRKWCSERCRKSTLYAARCALCGARCGTNDRVPQPGVSYHCKGCAPSANRIWTREACIAAVQDWAEAHGGIPPTAHARQIDPNAALPHANTVYEHFASYDDLIREAGYEPHCRGPVGGGYKRLTDRQRAEIPARRAAGESLWEIARDLGVTATSVHRWATRPRGLA